MKRKRTNKPQHMRRKRKTPIMKNNKKMLYTSSLALSLFSTGMISTNVLALEWAPRTVSEISPEIVQEEGKMTYTVRYGDTLSAIASAMNIDMDLLAKMNQIADVNLIFPDTVLTTTVDQNNQVTQVEIEAPVQGNTNETVQATVDLTTNQVTVEDTVIPLDQISSVTDSAPVEEVVEQPVAEAPVEEVVEQPVVEAPVEEVVEQPAVETPVEEVVEQPVVEAPVEEVVEQPVVEAPVEEVVEQPVVEAPVEEVVEQPVVEAPVEEVVEQPTVEAPVEEVVEQPVVEAPVVETPQVTALSTTTTSTSAYDVGLQPQVAAFRAEVANAFGITSFSGYRAGDSGDHGKGLAIDFMVPESSALGDQVAAYAVANLASKNINYIIWKQRFYAPYDSIYGPAYTWNLMPDRGSITENHYDHVHVSFN
ncbi:TPA: LysM peptidoglycan-binding domain-containing protein [Streptococcus suis]|uniref:LysM peptidoglycan-binding domain-containing protein n=2 Tax=Streptococcus suis TaxID=1307 RepID=UPI001379BB81|nr:LysM domain-containing protein [Streptococcus suis]NQI77536.1 LysM peptidoglycan-binding domain-containing protein [Streptococcus suis]NQI79199.1 LysM peptidoglycan-binding domain-containing protein [Streptococcus suis]NQI83409.1 LysM peptidoglycan-binding domain-containing protein [Streptococcus suis]HEM4248768.1 LysM peptidoglycan-binding domain-containing protein [Streptococcus suis]HEM5945134.1 LysM peptidoglycan-binding domain-containing protein [Streptococcus suis]